jgi:predicted Rossmann fold nucleotide-binding protein DprA/Smf involved in DNA uptake
VPAACGAGGSSPAALARATGLASGAVAAALVDLELAGLIREDAGAYREVMRPS